MTFTHAYRWAGYHFKTVVVLEGKTGPAYTQDDLARDRASEFIIRNVDTLEAEVQVPGGYCATHLYSLTPCAVPAWAKPKGEQNEAATNPPPALVPAVA